MCTCIFTGQILIKVGRVVVRRDAVGDPDIRPGTALRGDERREGDREHWPRLPGRQEACKSSDFGRGFKPLKLITLVKFPHNSLFCAQMSNDVPFVVFR